jgi:hypothetical protein
VAAGTPLSDRGRSLAGTAQRMGTDSYGHELVVTRRITLHAGQVVVIDFAPPVDALAHTILDRLATEPTTHPVRTWLPFLAQTVYPDVAARLLRAGHPREDVTRSLLGRRVRYVPANVNTAAWPWARLSQRLRASRWPPLMPAGRRRLTRPSQLPSRCRSCRASSGSR